MNDINNEIDLELSDDGNIVYLKGEVVEILPSEFKVKLENGAIISAKTSGKMRKNRIRVLLYDIVNIEISVSDIANLGKDNVTVHGRITFRYKA